MSGQSTQYNSIPKPYNVVMEATAPILSRVNVRDIVSPFIKNANVLDLACGTGFHSRAFVKMGARKVLGVDISSGMLAEARASTSEFGDRISFIEADGSKPVAYPGGPFDLVFGGWFLNYAPDKKTMVDMYRTIYLNLKPGGHFVAVTPVPTNDPEDLYARERILRPLFPSGRGLFTTLNKTVEDGIHMHRHTQTPVGNVDFDTYHLRKDVWEAAAREAGFQSEPVWKDVSAPDDFMENPTKYGEPHNGGATAEELAANEEIPHMSLLHFVK